MVYKNPFPKDFKATILLSIDNKLLENRAKTKNASTNNKTTRHSAHRSTRFIIPSSSLASPAQKENEKQFFNLLKNLVRPPRGSKTKFPQRPRLKRIPANRSHPTGKYLASRRYRGEGGPPSPLHDTKGSHCVPRDFSLSLVSFFPSLIFFILFYFFPPSFFSISFFFHSKMFAATSNGESFPLNLGVCIHSGSTERSLLWLITKRQGGGKSLYV